MFGQDLKTNATIVLTWADVVKRTKSILYKNVVKFLGFMV
jgi:hypothetical protein